MKFGRWLLPIASLAVVLWLTWRDVREGRASPGPLHSAHAAVAELAQGGNCEACHRPGAGIDPDGCVRCHAAVGAQRGTGQGLHGRLPAEQFAQCGQCHGEHHGDAVALIAPHAFPRAGVPDAAQYDHAHVSFGLVGVHARLACAKCHARADDAAPPAGGRFLGLQQRCTSCHEDAHKGRFGGSCTECHGQDEPWAKAAKFDHARFPLLGAHAGRECAACHQPGTAADLAAERAAPAAVRACNACHADPHGGTTPTALRLPDAGDCARCHAPTAWREARPDAAAHARFDFALHGPHARAACSSCHGDRGTPPRWTGAAPTEAACAACHANSPHRAEVLAAARVADGPGDGCAGCHRADDAAWTSGRMTASQHAQAGFVLTPPHHEVACSKCHTAPTWGERYPGRSPDDCRACHQDVHGGQFADEAKYARCTACHDRAHWAPPRFGVAAHAATAFPLTGAHEAVACGRCHAQADGAPRAFHGTSSRCADCHRDVHQGRFDRDGLPKVVGGGADCARCHDTTAFAPTTAPFDHARWTGHALAGAHVQLACAACHPAGAADGRRHGAVAGTDCASCHRDVHEGQFAVAGRVDCARCHEPTKWLPSVFDHQTMSRFRLDAMHGKLACSACHQAQPGEAGFVVRYKPLGTQCADCHRLGRNGEVRR